MNIRKKASGIAFSATLLASLIAVVAAPFASASVSVTSAGTISRGGTSATPATFTLRENSIACFGNGAQTYAGAPIAGYISIQIKDNAGNPTVHFVPPVGLSAPFSLGATTTLQSIASSNDTLTVQVVGHDDLNIEQIVESAKISADSTAATGAISAKIVAIPPFANPGATNQGPCVVTYLTTVTASGRLGNSTTPTLTNTTSAAGTSTTVVDTTPGFTPGALAGYTVTMTSGTPGNIGQTRTIASNTASTLTVSVAFPAATAAGDGYTVNTTSYPVGSNTFNIVLDAGSCDFVTTGTGGTAGNLAFVTNPENHPITTAPASAIGLQNGVVTTPGTSNAHFPGENVTQTGVPNCVPLTFPFTIGSPGTVANALTETNTAPTVVNVGENNQNASTVTLAEAPGGASGTFAAGQVVVWTITTAGAVFSSSPNVNPTGNLDLGAGPGNTVTCTLSVDRKSCSTPAIVSNTEPVAATGTESMTLGGIRLDIDTTAVAGSPVNIVASVSPSVPINLSGVTVAFIGRVVVAIAAQPTIYIGFNDQQSGMKTLTESAPGFFQSGISSNNTFGLCLVTGETFTRAPWAVVTVGDLKILNPVTATGSASQMAILTNGGQCAYWTVFSGSTVASTIEIRGSADNVTPLASGSLNGPRLSVPLVGVTPGSTQDALLIGTAANVIPGCTTAITCSFNPAFAGMLSQAIRAFKNSVTVTASSQPNCPPGTLDCLLGNIVITETQNGQFKPGDIIRGYFLPSANSLRNDVLIKAGNTNDLPIIATNAASGLLVSSVTVICPPNIPLLNICFFAFAVTQQSFGPTLGQVTVSNIHATIANGAQTGPIQMDWGNTALVLGIPVGTPAGQPFESVVSNGNIGSGPAPAGLTKTSAASAVTKTQTGPFSVGTKVVKLVSRSNNVVTIRIKLDPALVGKSVTIQRATKNSAGVWSSFTNLTTRIVGSDGYAYFYASAHSAQWNSYRGSWAGNAQWAPSHSQAVQVRWIN